MKKLQIGAMPKASIELAEAFNRMRVNLGFCGDKAKIVMITSGVSGEGKTFVSMQLWKQLAEVGIPTALIDCDLQNSKICSTYNIDKTKELNGITQYLSGQVALEEVLYETNVPNGYIIPVTSCVERPEVLLAGERFPKVIEECKKRFGCVLIDTSSIKNLPDVMNIATFCDGTVLVVRSAAISRKMASNCVQALQCTGKPVLGIVLNRFDASNKTCGYYYRYRN